ncbi:MAG: hypothetical protein A2X94_12560 [Bdellovibrionales bacterium GWB1_55_8]|nr:MAG: hypothetical protein A2X94_12560 [Bdellovibrionales bacterium GWB1_55_8]
MTNERAFLHSVANPLATAKFILEMVVEDFAARENDQDLLVQLNQVVEAVDQATKLLSDRRSEIIRAEEPPGS